MDVSSSFPPTALSPNQRLHGMYSPHLGPEFFNRFLCSHNPATSSLVPNYYDSLHLPVDARVHPQAANLGSYQAYVHHSEEELLLRRLLHSRQAPPPPDDSEQAREAEALSSESAYWREYQRSARQKLAPEKPNKKNLVTPQGVAVNNNRGKRSKRAAPASEVEPPHKQLCIAQGQTTTASPSFPLKLMAAMIKYKLEQGNFGLHQPAFAWNQGGTSFIVLHPDLFLTQVLQKHGVVDESATYSSFVRKLIRYGFVRKSCELGQWFHHPCFRRALVHLCQGVKLKSSESSRDGKIMQEELQSRTEAEVRRTPYLRRRSTSAA